MISPDKFAALLGVNEHTIRRWCIKGMPHWWSGNHRRIDMDAARQWLSINRWVFHRDLKPDVRRKIAEFIEAN